MILSWGCGGTHQQINHRILSCRRRQDCWLQLHLCSCHQHGESVPPSLAREPRTGSSQASTPSPACFLDVTRQVPQCPGDSLLPSVVILVLALFFLPGDQSLPDTGHTQALPLCSEAISCKDSSQGRSESPGTVVRTWAGQGSCYCLLWLSA